eukprot:XP_024998592.1 uncharacterized protein LOC112530166 [Gallus gallus]
MRTQSKAAPFGTGRSAANSTTLAPVRRLAWPAISDGRLARRNEKMEPRELVKEEILETKRSASQKLSLGYLHVAVRQKMGMKTRAETDPTLHQGHVSYAGDSGPANATRNRKLFFNVRCCLRPPSGFSCKKMWMKIK